MMNLLPDDRKAEIRAARTNVILIRYIGILLLAVTFIFGALYTSYAVLLQTKNSADELIASNDTQAGIYSETKAKVDTLSASLVQTKVILDQEVLYSKVLVKIAQQMPAGTIIDKLTLDQASFSGTPITLKVYAKTADNAVAVQSQFKSSPLFSSVNFQSVVNSGSGIDGYPVSIEMTATLNPAAAK